MELRKCLGSEVNQWWYTEVQRFAYHSEVRQGNHSENQGCYSGGLRGR